MATAHVTNTPPSPADAACADDSADNPPEPDGPSRHASRASTSRQSPVEVIWAATGPRAVDLNWITEKLTAVCRSIDRPVDRLAVRIVSDAEMSRLHEKHAGVKGTTDVLTFDTPGSTIDVDIAICCDEASRRAGEFDHSIDRELLLYAVHGLLHCLGFDDHDPRKREHMHAEEDRLLQSVGVEPTFAPRTRSKPGMTKEGPGHSTAGSNES